MRTLKPPINLLSNLKSRYNRSMRAGESRASFEMSCNYPWGFLFLVLCLLQSMLYMSCGCSVEERAALMDIRSSLMRINSMVPLASSWGRGEDCCSWEHVKCNNSTWRVSHLYLSNLYEPSYGMSAEDNWYINPLYDTLAKDRWHINWTVFSAFHELQFLDLSENHLSSLSFDGLARLTKLWYLNLSYNHPTTNDALPDAAFENLQNLRILDLSYNRFNGSLPMSLFALPHLKIVDLSRNIFEGRIPISSSSEPVSLEVLNLSCNIMSGALPIDQAFENLQNLRTLDLSGNEFNGSLPMSLFALPHLKILDLSENFLGGRIPISSSSEPVSLEVLDLSNNRLSGALPTDQVFENLRNLRELHLSSNLFSGNFPTILFSLPQIEVLDLSGNLLEGPIPISSSSNLSLSLKSLRFSQNNLEELDLSNNNLSGSMPNWLFTKEATLRRLNLGNNLLTGSLDPIWQVISIAMNRIAGQLPDSISSMFPSLSVLVFSDNNFSGDIPRSLCHIDSMEYLDLSNNKFSGELPACVLSDLPKLSTLKVSNNQLGGLILGGMNNLSAKLEIMYLDSNKFEGTLPRNLSGDLQDNKLSGNLDTSFWDLPNLRVLNLADNRIIGEIHPTVCGLPSIELLDLSSNKFSGELPACVFSDLTSLQILNVSNNQLGGLIRGGMNNLSAELEIMYLDSNKFEGTLPRNLSARYLGFMDLHDNKLSGNLDTSFWDLPNLQVLNLAGNLIIGEIHPTACGLPSIELLDLSNNNLAGSIPNCSRTTLRFLYVSGNSLYGDIPNAFLSSSDVMALDLRYNRFTGNLDWIQYLDDISLLSLGGNKFEGQITPKMCRLQSLRIIDLSHNSLSGSLPPCIGDIPFNYFDGEDFWEIDYIIISDKETKHIYDLEGFAFSTKGNLYTYRRSFLSSMSGIDLSGNSLSGEIPWELGNLSHIKALNLSYNFFTGPIPESFANMSEIESMDLSHNKLSGQIPWQLTQLSTLEVFSVAYNNLSGCAPNTGQFGSFGMDSYKGNNNLQKASQGGRCTSRSRPGSWTPEDTETKEDDPVLFAVSAASFVLAFWATVAFVFCHPSGQRVILKL